MEQAATRDSSREQIAARFMDVPPDRPILALFHVFEPTHSRLNSEEEYDRDLHDQEADHKTQNAADAVVSKQRDHQERRKNGRATAKRIANSSGAHSNVGGKQFGDVNGEEKRYLHVDRDHQQETCDRQENRILDERIDSAKEDGQQGCTKDCRLSPPNICC